MTPDSEFGQSTRLLAKNPLGIIALLTVIIYALAALAVGVVGTNSQLSEFEHYLIIWFLILFPILVLIFFTWLVSKHHRILHAPIDSKNDEAFIKASVVVSPGLAGLVLEIDKRIHEVLNPDETANEIISISTGAGNGTMKALVKKILENKEIQIKDKIRKSSFICIKASNFTKPPNPDTFDFPIDAFANFGELKSQVYHHIKDYVELSEYGRTWVLKNESNGQMFRSPPMLNNTPSGIPVPDLRTLNAVGISPGMILLVSKP